MSNRMNRKISWLLLLMLMILFQGAVSSWAVNHEPPGPSNTGSSEGQANKMHRSKNSSELVNQKRMNQANAALHETASGSNLSSNTNQERTKALRE